MDQIDINKYIVEKYIKNKDKDINTSTERLDLFKDINNDPVLIEYLSSDYFKSKQIKSKLSFLSEDDPFLRKMESIATYILHPDFKKYNIKSKEQLRDLGRFKCKKTGKYKKFNRKIYLEQIVENINKNSDYDDYVSVDELATNIIQLPDNNNLWEVFDFGNKKHIKQLLHVYHMIIPEIEGNPDTRVWSLVVVLNELINKSNLSPVDRDIVLLLQNGNYSYQKIKKKINKKFRTNYSYETIKKKISLLIPRKIANTYRKMVNKINI